MLVAVVKVCSRCGSTFTPEDIDYKLCDACVNVAAPEPSPEVAVKRWQKIKKASRKQEKRVMDGIGGRVQPASGARPHNKSDGRLRDRIRMEAKFTYSNSYRVNLTDLNKLRSECQGHERPAFVVAFVDKPTGRTNDEWVLMTRSDWEKLVNNESVDNS